ncbi:MAG: tandem-95 repeat protein [Actinobacteria bacterium]|nr:tandem-95 repeat protein [Actinomycetota bacterium]
MVEASNLSFAYAPFPLLTGFRRALIVLLAAGALLVVGAWRAEAVPGNDAFAYAASVGPAIPTSVSADTVGATTEPDEPLHCDMDATLWYAFTPSTSGVVVIDTVGSGFDTVLAVFDGDPFAGDPSAPTHLIDCNDDFHDLQSQVTVEVTSGTTYRIQVGGWSGDTGALTLNLAEAPGGVISGTVTDAATGALLAGICVETWGETTIGYGSDVTDATGSYTLGGLSPDSYRVYLYDCGGGGYIAEYHQNAPDWESATLVVLGDGEHVTVNEDLSTGGSIFGQVTEAGTTTGIENVCVTAHDPDLGLWSYGTTDANGDYVIGGVEDGSYTVYFTVCDTGPFIPEYFDDAADATTATRVAVSSGAATEVDEDLSRGGVIHGIVSAAGGGGAIGNVCVHVYGENTGVWTTAYTDEAGQYETEGLPADNYRLEFIDCSGVGYLTEYYDEHRDWLDSDLVSLALGQMQAINEDLSLGGTITGHVTDTTTGDPIEFVCVSVEDDAGIWGSDVTDMIGHYEVPALYPGMYKVHFSDCGGGGYGDEWYNDQTTFETADAVEVFANMLTHVEEDLSSGGRIEGVITDAGTTDTLVDICVDVTGNLTGHYGFDATGADGHYSIGGLPADDYRIHFYDCGGLGYHEEYWDEQPDWASAHLQPVGENQTVTIDEDLVALGRIAGTLVDAADGVTPAQGVCAWAVDVLGGGWYGANPSDESGGYLITGLPDGDYKVLFEDCLDDYWLSEWYADAADETSATPVSVVQGVTTSVDEDLVAGGRLGGTVLSDLTGNGVDGICIDIHDTGDPVARDSAWTGWDGAWQSSVLPAGDYQLFLSDCTRMRYHDEWYDDAADQTGAAEVAVIGGQVTDVTESLFADNVAPDAVEDVFDVLKNRQATLSPLDNDTDGDGDGLTITAVETADAAEHGVVSHDGSTITYVPAAGFLGSDTFDYTVDDGFGGTDTATITVTVADCPDLTPGIDDAGLVTGYEWVECSAIDANGLSPQVTSHFPVVGDSMGLMTSGDRALAPTANDGGGDGRDNAWSARGANDPSILRLDLDVPDGGTCLAMHVAFMSEEYPEYVGSGYNDAFLAELDATTWSVSDSVITAPDNFALAPGGDLLSINSVFFDGARAIVDNGTTYDGMTAQLRVQTPVTPGEHSLFLTIFDQGDGIYDSAAFVDDLHVESDPEGGCTAGVNALPEAEDNTAATDEDTHVDIDVLANDSDADLDPLTIVAVDDPAHGTATIVSGQVRYVPDTNWFGTEDPFTYTIADAFGGFASATINVDVAPVNDAPVADDLGETTDEDTPVDVTLTASDVEGDPFTFSIVDGPASGILSPIVAGVVTYTPAADTNGMDSFTYRASDADDGPIATVTLDVTAVNDAPDAVDDGEGTDEDVAVDVAVLANDSDVDLVHEGDTLTVTGVSDPANGTVSIAVDGQSVSYTPDPDWFGEDTFTYTLSDADGAMDTATVTVTVNPVNDAPVADDLGAITDEDTAVDVTLTANDVEGDPFVFSIVVGPASGTLSPIGAGASVVTYTPDADANGMDSFTYRASDADDGPIATVTLDVTPVNDAPVASPAEETTAEDTPLEGALLATDVDGDELSYVVVAPPAHGEVVLGVGEAFTYTPHVDYNGADSFTFKANDGVADSNVAAVSITVTPVNDAPEAADNLAWVVEEDASVVIMMEAGDVEDDPLTFSIVAGPEHGGLSVVDGNQVTYTPVADYSGSDSFTFRANDGGLDSNVATIGIDVTPVNDAPTVDEVEVGTSQNSPVQVILVGADVDNDPLVFSIVSGPSSGTLGPVSGNQVTYTPDDGYFGPDSFTFKANDGTVDSGSATVSVTVLENSAPVASAVEASTAEDTAKQLTLPASDADDDSLTWSIVSAPVHGDLGALVGNVVTYTPDPDYNGTDSFTFKANDGLSDSNVATVDITVTPVNDAPEAAPNTYEVDEDSSVVVVLEAGDVEDDPLTFSIVAGPDHGSLSSVSGGEVTYTPDADYDGVDSFTFKVNDGEADSNVATIGLDVLPINDPPTATDTAVEVSAGQSVTVTLPATDVDNTSSQLTFSVGGSPSKGTLSSVSGNQVTYTANVGTSGTDSFTFKVNDGAVDSNTATVSVTVKQSTTSTNTTVEPGGTASTEGTTATSDNPVVTAVTSPTGGEVTVQEGERTTGAPSGYRMFDVQVEIHAPDATVEEPLLLVFRVHESQVPDGARSLTVFRNGRRVPNPCTHPTSAQPDPCTASIVKDGEEWVITVRTSKASTWNFGEQTDVEFERLSGDGRIQTAVAISADTFTAADTVIIARSDKYPDALAGAPLAAKLAAPILLTTSDVLDPAVAAEVDRLGADRAILLGGETALSPVVRDQLLALGVATVDRIAGNTRFDTAAEIAKQVGGRAVYVTEGANADEGRGWPDAVAVSGLAAFQQRPIVLAERDVLPGASAAVLDALGVTQATIVGGEAAVSAAVAGQITQHDVEVGRIAGANRYDTSRQVAEWAVVAGMDPATLWVATGLNFPDALAAGPAVAATKGVLVLVHGQTLDNAPASLEYIEAQAASIARVALVGGDKAVTETVAGQIADAIAAAGS